MIGTAFVHTVIDDHSRGITVRRVLSDIGSAYRSHQWREVCAELGITPKKTRPDRPQTNGKIERFHRALADGWAFAEFYSSEKARRAALPAFLHDYNHHRPHTAIGGLAPITRLTNLAGHHS
jgi:transposase InsO family protein